MSDEKPITVQELIDKLMTMPLDAYVYTEGCDCVGPCSGAELMKNYKDKTTVLLLRDDSRSG